MIADAREVFKGPDWLDRASLMNVIFTKMLIGIIDVHKELGCYYSDLKL